MRFKITSALGLMFVAAVLIACFALPNANSVQLIGTMTQLMIAFATIAAFLAQSNLRWFGMGFAVTTIIFIAGLHLPYNKLGSFYPTSVIADELDRLLQLSRPHTAPTGEVVVMLARDGKVQVNLGGKGRLISQVEAEAQGLAKYAYSEHSYPTNERLNCIALWTLILLAGVAGGVFATALRLHDEPSK